MKKSLIGKYVAEDAYQEALDGLQATVWTALPCLIQSYNPKALTVEAQPTISGKTQSPDGAWSSTRLPMLVDVPVVFPCGGGHTLTFPIAPGDECLVVFASRAIDGWWQQGHIQAPTSSRMHDLSDGFALVGPRSLKRRLSDVSTTTTQLRSDDGETFVEIDGDAPMGSGITLKTPGKMTLECDEFVLKAGSSIAMGVSSGVMQLDMDSNKALWIAKDIKVRQ